LQKYEGIISAKYRTAVPLGREGVKVTLKILDAQFL
jgi:hypothetical protein